MSLPAFKEHFEGFLSGSGIIQHMDGPITLDFGEAFEKMFKDGIPVKINIKKPKEVIVTKSNGKEGT